MDAVDDIFSTPSLSLWESPHLASAFPLAPSPPNPQNFLRQSDNSAFPSTDNSLQHPLTDPQDLPPDLSSALASSFSLPNSLHYSIPPNIFSQFNHPSLPFDINSLPTTTDTHHPPLDPNTQFLPQPQHQPPLNTHQPQQDPALSRTPSTKSRHIHQRAHRKTSHNPPTANIPSNRPSNQHPTPRAPSIPNPQSRSALNHSIRRTQPPTANPSLQNTRNPRQHHHPQPQSAPPDNPSFLPNTSAPITRPRQTQSTPHHPVTSIPQPRSIPTSQSNSNLLSRHTSSAPISRLSSISIPTPTIATATTTAASPSTTNATNATNHTPPQTPPSAKRPKSTATSNPKRHQVEPRSVRPKTNTDKKLKHTQPTPSNHHGTTQTSAKQSSTIPQPSSPSASTHHNIPHHSTSVLNATHRISKPRDKHARLRKRLKCCSQDQLVDQIIQLVRSSTIPEKIVTDSVPKVDMHRYVLKCRELRDSILCQLPQDNPNPATPFDATVFRKCKKSLAVFRTSVVNMAKTLVEASLWTDVIEFCIAAEGVNAETPVWSEASHNRTKRSVRSKLEQFALKAATALSKPKEAAAFTRDDHARAMQGCQGVFPDVVAKLKRQTPSAPTESHTRSQEFDHSMIGTTQLDVDIA